MPRLVKCEIAKESQDFLYCPECSAHLRPNEETKRTDKVILLCPKCHRFFNERGVIPYEEADEMFPGESNIYY